MCIRVHLWFQTSSFQVTNVILDNAQLWIGDGTTYRGHVIIDGDRITRIAPGKYRGDERDVTDLAGAALSPGMIDMMVLGGFDRSLLHDDVREIARQYLRLGVTTMQLCIGTLSWEAMTGVVENTQRAMAHASSDMTRVHGVYFEGPFQHPELTGASKRELALPATQDNVQRVIDAFGRAVTMINVAPGIDRDAQAVGAFVDAGKRVTMAHANAPAARVLRCIDAGTSQLGHVFDNNSGLIGDSGVQQPTLEHVALVDERVRFIHLICDGQHVHPILIRMILRCRGLGAVCLITDGNQRMGTADGPFTWADGRSMYKKHGVCRTAEKDWLAGSATPLPDMFRNFVRFTGLAGHVAIRSVTLNPAQALGIEHDTGRLAPGCVADLLMWDNAMRVRRIWRAGVEVRDVSDFTEPLAAIESQ